MLQNIEKFVTRIRMVAHQIIQYHENKIDPHLQKKYERPDYKFDPDHDNF